MVCSIKESNNLTIMTIDELHSSLLIHEQRMQGRRKDEHALKITNTEGVGGREEERFGGRGRARGGYRGRGRGKGRMPINKTTIESYKCHKLEHFQCECPDLEKGANYAELDDEEEMLLMSYHSYVELHNSKREEVWFLNSGCCNHRSGNKLRFQIWMRSSGTQ